MAMIVSILVVALVLEAAAGQAYTDNSSTPIPALRDGQQPNFIVILTDDQGWDDIGLHNPRYVRTPNLDKFIRQGTLFDNYYTAPQCAQTRAQLLTGRAFARTGTMRTNSCYDFIHRDEVTMGAVLQQAGYHTAQFGKWHNLDVLGYEPWHVGFQESYIPKAAPGAGLMRVNGVYTNSSDPSYPEKALADVVEGFLDRMARQAQLNPPAKPFLLYYSPHLIHTHADKSANGTVVGGNRFVPPELYRKYHNNTKYAGIPSSTLDAWASLEYLDTLLGGLWDYVESLSELRDKTYIMIMGDNGSALLEDEAKDRKYRMLSRMRGHKSTLYEGGIRNWLAVRGPGISAGVSDSTLLDASDILPTLVDLAGIEPGSVNHLPWDGLSFKNLLLAPTCKGNCRVHATTARAAAHHRYIRPSAVHKANGDSTAHSAVDISSRDNSNTGGGGADRSVGKEVTARSIYNGGIHRGTALATQQQLDRFVVVLGPECWDSDLVLRLDANREIRRPQLLLDWRLGGKKSSEKGAEPGSGGAAQQQETYGPGFKECLVVRYKEYKWIGAEDKVYRLDDSHREERRNLVKDDEGNQLRKIMFAAARAWWNQMVMEAHSFSKPVYYLGLGNWTVTNMLTCGAFQRTEHSVRLMRLGVSGFVNPGDRMCFNVTVVSNGTYDVTMFYVSSQTASFQLAIGTWHSILQGTAAAISATLPPASTLAGQSIGQITLPSSTPEGKKLEACLQLLKNSIPGKPVFSNLANIRMTRRLEKTRPIHDRLERLQLGRGGLAGTKGSTPRTPGVLETANGQAYESKNAPAAIAAAGIDLCQAHSHLPSLSDTIAQKFEGGSGGRSAGPSSSSSTARKASRGNCSSDKAWQQLRMAHGWPDGQEVFESMFAVDAEDSAGCAACKPPI